MLRKILSLVLNYNGRVERKSTQIREANGTQQTNPTGGSQSSIGSVVPRSNEKKILPDPWFN
jgi:hypothetical protein